MTAVSPTTPGSRVVTSDDEGSYRLANLSPADYTITGELQGFTKVVREGVAVREGLNLALDLAMLVGSVSESVTVIERPIGAAVMRDCIPAG